MQTNSNDQMRWKRFLLKRAVVKESFLEEIGLAASVVKKTGLSSSQRAVLQLSRIGLCGSRVRDDVSKNLDNKKGKQDHPTCRGVVFPDHHHKSVVHRDVECDIGRQLFPVHGLPEWDLQYPVVQGFDRQE